MSHLGQLSTGQVHPHFIRYYPRERTTTRVWRLRQVNKYELETVVRVNPLLKPPLLIDPSTPSRGVRSTQVLAADPTRSAHFSTEDLETLWELIARPARRRAACVCTLSL